ncbi:MAG: AraC family transcriptional regulator ligand-binding domain-containing protein [Moraxellaceae bacterium]|nr:AraC family transcriptional regulator ligand-binding domain-containing protein [Moraxellaceae bacterium]
MTYPVTYIRLLARELRLDEAGQRQLLAGTPLTPADIGQLDREVSAADSLLILRNTLRLADRPGFGLEVGSRFSLAAHGPLGQLLSSSPSLADAWHALERYQALRVPLVHIRCRFERDNFVIALTIDHALDDIGLLMLEAMAVTVQRGIELIIGRRLKEARLQFAYPEPAHVDLYARYLHGSCRFNATHTAIRIPRVVMEEPNPFRDPQVWAQATAHCEALFQTLSQTRSQRQSQHQSQPLQARAVLLWRERITHVLQQHPGQLWTLVEVAAHFHLSPRTLMRHLKAEATSYQQLLDAELQRQAKLHLRSPRHTVESVALALGYQDATAFRRAFRRWCGESPSAWLARQPVEESASVS